MSWAQLVTDFGDFLCTSAVALVAVVWCWQALGRLTATAFALAYLIVVVLVVSGKWMSAQVFDDVHASALMDLSKGAPSGHAAMSVLVYGSIAYFCSRTGWCLRSAAALLACVGITAAVIVTRVVLHSHTVPDVAAGASIGALVLALPIYIDRMRADEPQSSPNWLLAGSVVAGALVLMSGVRVENDFGLL